jgi:hypothetical protein
MRIDPPASAILQIISLAKSSILGKMLAIAISWIMSKKVTIVPIMTILAILAENDTVSLPELLLKADWRSITTMWVSMGTIMHAPRTKWMCTVTTSSTKHRKRGLQVKKSFESFQTRFGHSNPPSPSNTTNSDSGSLTCFPQAQHIMMKGTTIANAMTNFARNFRACSGCPSTIDMHKSIIAAVIQQHAACNKCTVPLWN